MKYNCKKLSVLFATVMMFVLACPVTVLAAAEEEAGTPAVYATFWSLIPPVVAIVLALITKEVYLSLMEHQLPKLSYPRYLPHTYHNGELEIFH